MTTNFESAHVSTLTSIAIYNLVPLPRKETSYIYWSVLYMLLKDNEFERAAKSFQAKHSKIARITNKTDPWCWAGAMALQQLLCRSLPPAAYAEMGFLVMFFFLCSGWSCYLLGTKGYVVVVVGGPVILVLA
jgi:hypothetical protein